MKANFSQTCKTNVISYKKQGNPYMKTSSLQWVLARRDAQIISGRLWAGSGGKRDGVVFCVGTRVQRGDIRKDISLQYHSNDAP